MGFFTGLKKDLKKANKKLKEYRKPENVEKRQAAFLKKQKFELQKAKLSRQIMKERQLKHNISGQTGGNFNFGAFGMSESAPKKVTTKKKRSKQQYLHLTPNQILQD